MAALSARGDELVIVPQIAGEFWNVATRPVANNGLGLNPSEIEIELGLLEAEMTMLRDLPTIYDEWRRIVGTHAVRGVQVHDARLVAAMHVHGIDAVLTFNGRDFLRYEIEVLDPADFAA